MRHAVENRTGAKKVRKIIFIFFGLSFLSLILLVVLLLNSQILYARCTHYRQVNVYSEKAFDKRFNKVIDDALMLVEKSELYDPHFSIDVFLNDGSSFNRLMKRIYGDAFAWGYHNNVVLNGKSDSALNFIHLHGYQRHLARTIAHEMIHCLQYHKYGLFRSRPIKDVPIWKWEGYPEYVAYKSAVKNEKTILIENISRLIEYEKDQKFHWVSIEVDEGTSFAGINYFRSWLMVKYLLDVKQLKFDDVIKDKVEFDKVHDEMLEWHALNVN